MTESPLEPEREILETLLRVIKPLLYRGDLVSALHDLPISQLRCLQVIARSEGEKMLDLARKLDIKLPAMSQIVDRLVKRGMLERQDAPDDRRIVRLILTPMAKDLLATRFAERQARVKAATNHLGSREIDEVIKGLHLLAIAAERVVAEVSGNTGLRSLEADTVEDLFSPGNRLGYSRPAPP